MTKNNGPWLVGGTTHDDLGSTTDIKWVVRDKRIDYKKEFRILNVRTGLT